MAPFTPFITEHMFQNLRLLLPWELNDNNTSIHYIMMPKPRPVEHSHCKFKKRNSLFLCCWNNSNLFCLFLTPVCYWFETGLTGFPNRPDLIDKEIERAVGLMQSVVEAGRYIRDKIVIPIKVILLSRTLAPPRVI